jgi:hypothetical protein
MHCYIKCHKHEIKLESSPIQIIQKSQGNNTHVPIVGEAKINKPDTTST